MWSMIPGGTGAELEIDGFCFYLLIDSIYLQSLPGDAFAKPTLLN